ncbi:MAG TPA: chemotaxis protein CheA [Rhizomicrobium sp.]|jgi:two-component system chemotaxis sensor kinase CheA|nr:chemotaxis protein CheA [Rhizomicrobium sp.]
MNEFVEQFIIESRDLVEQASGDLLALEHDAGDKGRLDSAFRAFHTLKGGAGIVDFTAMARALHAAEDVLSAVRAGTRPITPALIGDCLTCLDQVVQWLDAMETSDELPAAAEAQADAIVARFAEENTPAAAAQTAAARSMPSSWTLARAILEEQCLLLAEAGPEGLAGRVASAARAAANVLRASGRDAADVEQAGDAGYLIAAITQALTEAPMPEKASAPDDTAPRSFRVDAERVDALVNLTGELTVAKNTAGHLAKLAQDGANPLAAALAEQHAQFDRLVGALQHAVLSMRVLPLRQVFQRFPRLVREMAVKLDKSARLVTEGDDTEADKAIVEALYEPLLHVLRNAVDHGVESATERAAAGKTDVATILLRAGREGEHVVVEVEDDGRGIDVARVRQVASERGVGSAESLAALSDAEVIDLIFAPGFSTASEVTGLSGRGVGMDAVRSAVERLGGRVSVESRAGRGSAVRFDLPFSVMMTQVMTVEAGGQMFGIPLDAVVETIRVPRERIKPVGAAYAIVHRDQTVPVIDLARTLGHGKGADRTAEATLVTVFSGGQLGAFEVERLGARVDVMLKPMAGLLSGIPGVSGTTLLGDGTVLLVLDILALLS